MTEAQINTHIDVNGVPLGCFGWLADRSACGYYRVLQPLQKLAQKHGVQVEVGAQSTLPFTVLVAQRSHKPEVLEYLRSLKATRPSHNGVPIPKIVLELDDDLWSIEPDSMGYDYYSQPEVQQNLREALELADMVTVSTDPLAKIVGEFNDNVAVLPNSVPDRLLNESAFPYTTGQMNKPYVIGWAGSATHANDFRMCASALNTVLRLIPDSRMVFFGTNYSHLLDPSVRSQCRSAPWTSSISEYHRLVSSAQIDVMLAPLAPTKFNESKSNLRLIEANALGIPVIATDFGPYMDAGDGVLLVKPGDSWVLALTALQNPITRMDMSAKGRDWVRRGFTMGRNVDLWLQSYESVLVP